MYYTPKAIKLLNLYTGRNTNKQIKARNEAEAVLSRYDQDTLPGSALTAPLISKLHHCYETKDTGHRDLM